jgi:hypothetical protein
MKTKILIPLAGLVFFCACKGSNSASDTVDTVSVMQKQAVDATPADSDAADQTKIADTVPVAQKHKAINRKPDIIAYDHKLVTTADMRFKVKDVRKTTEQIAALTKGCNGTVVNHFVRSTTVDSSNVRKSDDSLMRITVVNTTADMTVKVPPGKVEEFVNQVADMGISIDRLNMHVNDKTFDYLATRLKLKNQRELVDQNKGAGHPKTPDEIVTYKNSMVDDQVQNLKTDDSTKNSVITLNFYEANVIHKETIANPDLSNYNQPIYAQFASSIKNGWSVFTSILIALANGWILVPIALAIWFGVRYFNKRKKVVV